MSLHPLWEEGNVSPFSSIFTVPSNRICILYADKFQKYKFRTTVGEVQVEQAVCVRRILHGFTAYKKDKDACGFIFNIENVRAEKIVDMLVQTCGLPWQLTLCRNLGIIGIPGSYRLELNDPTAIGEVQVYAELYDVKSLPPQVQNLFF